MNPFLPKVLENLGAVVYDEIDNEGQTCFSINSVVSSYGEQLTLKQVKSCIIVHSQVTFIETIQF